MQYISSELTPPANPFYMRTLPNGRVEVASFFWNAKRSRWSRFLSVSNAKVPKYSRDLGSVTYHKESILTMFFFGGFNTGRSPRPRPPVLTANGAQIPGFQPADLGFESPSGWILFVEFLIAFMFVFSGIFRFAGQRFNIYFEIVDQIHSDDPD